MTALADLSPQALAVAVGLLAIIVVTAVKLFWGMALWAKKSDHRVGERWGEEAVEVVEWSGRAGYVRAGGELWRAAASEPLAAGDRVRVVRTKGLLLEVKKIAAAKDGA